MSKELFKRELKPGDYVAYPIYDSLRIAVVLGLRIKNLLYANSLYIRVRYPNRNYEMINGVWTLVGYKTKYSTLKYKDIIKLDPADVAKYFNQDEKDVITATLKKRKILI